MIFPLEDAVQDENLPTVPKEYEIDFETGQLTGRIVSGIEAVKCWIWMALQTPRYRYYIYSWDYGQEYETLIGKGYSREFTTAALEGMTEETLLENPYIDAVEDFSTVYEEEKALVSFTVKTKFGEVRSNVRGDDIRVSFE